MGFSGALAMFSSRLLAVVASSLMALIRFYRYAISPLFTPRCRFFPSCSEYALLALQRHGLLRGLRLSARRVCRCHPWGGHGVDLVPEREHVSHRH